jgi:hypothetical protein
MQILDRIGFLEYFKVLGALISIETLNYPNAGVL